jgi:hypothetical protein
MTAQFQYGSFDGEPFIYGRRSGRVEAWVVREGAENWSQAESAEIGMNGRVLA